jgi:hypothetical protein
MGFEPTAETLLQTSATITIRDNTAPTFTLS